jgi:hypothetical protein
MPCRRSSDIAARPIEARHQTGLHGVGRADHYDRNRRGVVFGGPRRHLTEGHDHVDPARHQFLGQRGQPVHLPLRRTTLNHQIMSDRITALPQSLDKPVPERRGHHAAVDGQEADLSDFQAP